jgi:hypothetical protein
MNVNVIQTTQQPMQALLAMAMRQTIATRWSGRGARPHDTVEADGAQEALTRIC